MVQQETPVGCVECKDGFMRTMSGQCVMQTEGNECPATHEIVADGSCASCKVFPMDFYFGFISPETVMAAGGALEEAFCMSCNQGYWFDDKEMKCKSSEINECYTEAMR